MPERGTLDISKAKKLLTYEPKFSISVGYLKYIKWYKDFGVNLRLKIHRNEANIAIDNR